MRRASGEQTYSIGWARYSGTGPSTASDTAVLGSNSTEVNGLGGVAGSSIPNQGWLADIETTSTTLGASTALAHILGLGFYGIALATAVHLFRSQFSCKRPLFRPAAKASGALFVWLVGIGVAGFYLAIKEKFEEKIIATLNSEGFLCEVPYFVGKCKGVGFDFACTTIWLGLMICCNAVKNSTYNMVAAEACLKKYEIKDRYW